MISQLCLQTPPVTIMLFAGRRQRDGPGQEDWAAEGRSGREIPRGTAVYPPEGGRGNKVAATRGAAGGYTEFQHNPGTEMGGYKRARTLFLDARFWFGSALHNDSNSVATRESPRLRSRHGDKENE